MLEAVLGQIDAIESFALNLMDSPDDMKRVARALGLAQGHISYVAHARSYLTSTAHVIDLGAFLDPDTTEGEPA